MNNFIFQLIILIGFFYKEDLKNEENKFFDTLSFLEKEAEYYYYSGDYLNSLNLYIRVSNLKEKSKIINKVDIAKTYYNISTNLLLLFDYCNSLVYLEKAENIYSKDTIRYLDKLISVYLLKAIIYYNKGDYRRAEFILNYTIKLFEKLKSNLNLSSKNEIFEKKIKIYNALASVYFEMKDYINSLKFYELAKKEALKINDKLMLPIIKGNIANIAAKINDHNKANIYYKEAFSEILSLRQINYLYLMIINNYIIYLTKNKNFVEARNLIKRIENIKSKSLSNFLNKYYINNFYGNFYFYKNNIDSSIYFFKKSLDIYTSNLLNVVDINLIRILQKLGKTYFTKFTVNNDVNSLIEASTFYKKVIQNIEKLKNSYLTQESRLFIIENEYNIYHDILDILIKLAEKTKNKKYYEEAFYIAEKLKGSVLFRMIKDNEAKIKGGIPDSILNKENEYKRMITLYRELIYEEQKSDNPREYLISKWEAKIIEYENSLEKLLNYLESNYINYYNLKYNDKILNINDVQKVLKRNEIVFEYVLTDTVLYIFIISKKNFLVNNIKLDSTFFKNIDEVYSCLNRINFYNDFDYKKFVIKLHYLYKILLKPYETLFKNKHLIILPDERLYYIPFEILLTDYKVNEEKGFKNLSYLIKKNPISYEYSCRLLIENKTRSIKKFNLFKRNKVALFAPEYNGKYLSKLRGTRQYNYRKDLLPIPGALKEINNISKIFKSDKYISKSATEKNFKLFGKNYDILHFAMHTIINNENPLYSKLVFSEPEDSVEDGFLNAYELYNMSLNANLVVLSSCSSGKGVISKGEGIISISRAFYYAGSSSLLLTLWEIEDNVSSELMVDYYNYLKKGYSKDRALQLAKVHFINRQPPFFTHPFYWSSYVVYGNTSPICVPLYYFVGILIFMSFLIIFLFFVKIKRN